MWHDVSPITIEAARWVVSLARLSIRCCTKQRTDSNSWKPRSNTSSVPALAAAQQTRLQGVEALTVVSPPQAECTDPDKGRPVHCRNTMSLQRPTTSQCDRHAGRYASSRHASVPDRGARNDGYPHASHDHDDRLAPAWMLSGQCWLPEIHIHKSC